MKSNVVQHQTDIRADIMLIDEIIKLYTGEDPVPLHTPDRN